MKPGRSKPYSPLPAHLTAHRTFRRLLGRSMAWRRFCFQFRYPLKSGGSTKPPSGGIRCVRWKRWPRLPPPPGNVRRSQGKIGGGDRRSLTIRMPKLLLAPKSRRRCLEGAPRILWFYPGCTQPPLLEIGWCPNTPIPGANHHLLRNKPWITT